MTYGYKNTFPVIESQLRRITVYHFGEKDISFHHNENGYIVGLKRTPNSPKKSKQQGAIAEYPAAREHRGSSVLSTRLRHRGSSVLSTRPRHRGSSVLS